MRVIIAGSRSLKDIENQIEAALKDTGWKVTEVVSGTARGVDQAGERVGKKLGLKVRRFPAQWNLYGRSAGYRRNEEMARHADALLALWDGKSRGTKNMIDIAYRKGLKVKVVEV